MNVLNEGSPGWQTCDNDGYSILEKGKGEEVDVVPCEDWSIDGDIYRKRTGGMYLQVLS